ncbi:hypothetical protein QMK33_18405 [Hymenobacter sp. H14-R3]|uniref:hypothetical protein n=1 Tax=Hymenobacter sp. H14-R3 TaxID=3046308 RepID=UPI0024BB41C2|nr:hypothetical protein [Hymenobacter sp. H14-R3]MDJ0367127.1 hypothetical protein [Hymenobacter sp. H14-R3]
MKIFSRFSKALSAGALAAVLLVASSGNQVALGAANATTATVPTTTTSMQAQMWWAAITGDFVQGIVDGLQRSPQFSEQNTLVAMQHYQSTDFSTFD